MSTPSSAVSGTYYTTGARSNWLSSVWRSKSTTSRAERSQSVQSGSGAATTSVSNPGGTEDGREGMGSQAISETERPTDSMTLAMAQMDEVFAGTRTPPDQEAKVPPEVVDRDRHGDHEDGAVSRSTPRARTVTFLESGVTKESFVATDYSVTDEAPRMMAETQSGHWGPGGGKALLNFLEKLDNDPKKRIYDLNELRSLIEEAGLDVSPEKSRRLHQDSDGTGSDARRGLRVQWMVRALQAYRLTSDTQQEEVEDVSYQEGWSSFRLTVHGMIRSDWFKHLMALLVVINVAIMVLAMDSVHGGGEYEIIITSILVLEIATRWYGCATHPRVFDLLLMWDTVLVSIQVASLPFRTPAIDFEKFGGGAIYWLLLPTRVCRLVHLFRFKIFKMVSGMMGCFPRAVLCVIWLGPPVGIYLLAWGVIFRAVFDHHLDEEGDVGEIARQFFSSFGLSLLTVQDVMFGSFQWSEKITFPMYRTMLRAWEQGSWEYVHEFAAWMLFEFLTGVIMANLITALIIQECVRRANAEFEFKKRTHIVTEELNIANIKQAFEYLDPGDTGKIPAERLQDLKHDTQTLAKLGIDMEDIDTFINALEVSLDESVQVVDILSLLVMMKGTTRSVQMMNFDLQTRRLRTEIREVTHRIRELAARVEDAQRSDVEHTAMVLAPLEGLQELRLARIELMNVRDYATEVEKNTTNAKNRLKGNDGFTVNQVRKSLDMSHKLQKLIETVHKVMDQYKEGSDFMRKNVEKVRGQIPERARQELADSIVERLREGEETQVELARRHVQRLCDKETTKIGQSFFV